MTRVAMVTEKMLLGYGVDEVVHVLSKELTRWGYEVTVITSCREFQPEGYSIITVKPLPLPFINQYWQAHFLKDIRLLMPVVRLLHNSDVIITFDPMHLVGALAKIALKKTVVMYYFGVVPPNVLDPLRQIESIRQKLIWNTSFAFADYIMTNSVYTKNLLPKFLRKKAVVNYHGVEHIINSDKEPKRTLNIRNKKVILSIGRLSSPYKGMGHLIDIFKQIKKRQNVRLLLVGRGSPEDTKNFNWSEDIIIMTNAPYETLKLYFASCDVYCSASRWEGFNIPLVVAQAYGKPVVAYRVGAHPEVIIHRETGFLAENTREFEKYLEVLCRDDSLREEMGRKAREHAKRFSWAIALKLLDNIIRRLIS